MTSNKTVFGASSLIATVFAIILGSMSTPAQACAVAGFAYDRVKPANTTVYYQFALDAGVLKWRVMLKDVTPGLPPPPASWTQIAAGFPGCAPANISPPPYGLLNPTHFYKLRVDIWCCGATQWTNGAYTSPAF